MATEQFTNDAASTLTASITSSSTSLTLASASTFPSAGQFRIRIDSEVLVVTAVSGSTFTVSRGAEGTTAAAHATGALVTHILTAGALAQLKLDAVWRPFYEVDYTDPAVLPAGTTSINATSFSIAGLTWTVTNNANMGAALVNGTGITFNPVSNSGDCGLAIPLSSLSSVAGRRIRLFVQMAYVGTAAGTADNYFLMSLQKDGVTNFSTANRVGGGFRNVAATGLRVIPLLYGSGAGASPTSSTDTTDDVFCAEIDGVQGLAWSGQYASGWPAPLNMRERGGNASVAFGSDLKMANAALGLYVLRGNAGNAMTGSVVKRISVQSLGV